jgi:hypothetical protein
VTEVSITGDLELLEELGIELIAWTVNHY